MGWKEFTGYIDVMNKQVEGEKGDPGSWRGSEYDPGWQELRAARERQRGR